MASIFDSLQGVLSSDFADKAASTLGEDRGKVASALSSMVPGLLNTLLAHKAPEQVEASIKAAGNEHDATESNLDQLTSGTATEGTKALGSNFIGSLLGDQADGFVEKIASSVGLSKESVSKLLGMVAPVVAGFLGNQLNSGNPLSGLLGQLGQQKSNLADSVPDGIGQLLQSPKLAGLENTLGDLGDLGKKFGF